MEPAALSIELENRAAIAVGNTAIAKPSELTPMTAYILCEIIREAGLPNGVLNVVHDTGPMSVLQSQRILKSTPSHLPAAP